MTDSPDPQPAVLPPKDEDPPGQTPLPKGGVQKVESRPSLITRVQGSVSRLFQFKSSSHSTIEEDVAELIEEHDPDGTQVSSEERSILSNVLGLSDSTVEDVMVPRTDIVAVDEKTSLTELKAIIIENEHTRTPVYKDSLDNVIGFVHIKDIIPYLGTDRAFDLHKILREVLYVPPSMKVVDLLVKMRVKRVHMALVLDEYGGTDGLVTMEDLVEEIVGEIEDEHDEIEEEEIKPLEDGAYEVSARASIEELEEKLGVSLVEESESEDFESVGGLVFYMLGHVPEKGEIITHPSGYTFEVTDADARSVKTLVVRKM